ncbi:MAG: hypothetical protein Fur0022_17120 [Anaerolineales bacterium]
MSPTPQTVLILLADISGYTQFMLSHQKALEHSQMVVGELLNTLLGVIPEDLYLVRVEGDALFLYAPVAPDASTWEANRARLEATVFALFDTFNNKLGELRAYSICRCEACRNIDKLRLKIIGHAGETLVYTMHGYTDLSGVDVIVAHRLLKNSVPAHQYLLLTKTACRDLALFSHLNFEHREETYDVGVIQTCVYYPPVHIPEIKRNPLQPITASNVAVEILRHEIRKEYSEVATHPENGFHFHLGKKLAEILGYPAIWVNSLPQKAVESFAGTGNPFSLGDIRSGERVVDVGSGAGFDALIAARLVGEEGRVIGVDMTSAMLAKARANAAEAGMNHLEFKEGFAENLPVPDEWADVVISNGVLNLCPDKLVALQEMHRVLKPNGRLQIGDILVAKAVPDSAKANLDLWTG